VEIPDDKEALSLELVTTKRAQRTLEKCYQSGELMDTFTVDHVLSKLNQNSVKISSCLSPIDRINLPYYKNFVNKKWLDSFECVCIPLCDGVHFQGYIIDKENCTVAHIDSLNPRNFQNPTATELGNIFFPESKEIKFLSIFKERVQFDSSSCGIWLVAAYCSFVLGLPLPEDKRDAFELAMNLIEHKSKEAKNESNSSETKPCSNHKESIHEQSTHQQFEKFDIDTYATSEFLIDVLVNKAEKSEFFREKPPKTIRSNYFYVTSLAENSLSSITSDDNGAYTDTRNIKKFYSYANGKVVHELDGNFYYNEKTAENSKRYTKVFLPEHDVVCIHRRYGKAKSFPLKRTISSLSYPANGPTLPYIGVFYRVDGTIHETTTQPHANSKNSNRQYIRTAPGVLKKAKDLIDQGIPSRSVYDSVNSESGGVFKSESQSEELRNVQQIYRQKNSLKKENGNRKNGESADELTTLIKLQRKDNFIRSICCLPDSYYAFLTTDAQLDDIVEFCCAEKGVLAIDTTFNLCDMWLTDTCYPNFRLLNNEGKHPIFLGPSLLHFQKDQFMFGRFAHELCSHKKGIKALQVIGTDLESAIYKGFSSEIDDLRRLLCVHHLENADREKLKNINPKSKNNGQILRDIYGSQYGTTKELGLVDSKDPEDFQVRLTSLKECWEKACPGFYGWFKDKRTNMFMKSVIESARVNTEISGLYYTNTIESQHAREKKEHFSKNSSIEDTLATLKTIIDRQYNDEVRALYGSGPYTVSKPFQKFIEPIRWHFWSDSKRKAHVERFRKAIPTKSELFSKPKKSGRKPNDRVRKRKLPAETIIDPLLQNAKKKIRDDDPFSDPKLIMELHLRSLLHRSVERCQGMCGNQLKPADTDDYYVVKSYGPSSYKVNGVIQTTYGPQYVHFNVLCLRNYCKRKHDKSFDVFPFDLIKVQ